MFAHNLKGSEDGKAIVIINTNKKTTAINIPSDAEQYTLTSNELEGTNVMLNGQELALTPNDELPAITGKNVKAGNVELPEPVLHSLRFQTVGRFNKQMNHYEKIRE